MEIPEDLRAYLARPENRKLTLPGCEVKEVTLFAPEELAVTKHDVSTFDFALQEKWEDWNRMEHQRYWFRGVNLVKTCRHYQAAGVFLWFPDLGTYGQWDCDHHKIIVFPEATWADIIKNPTRYFNGMWESFPLVHRRYLRPWENEAEQSAAIRRSRE